MSSHEFWQSIIIMIVLLFFSAFFSASETAFTSLNRIRIKNKADDGDLRAKRVLHLDSNYDNLLSTILIGNNLVNIGTTAVATVFFVNLFGDIGPTVATIVTTVVVLIFGEITPKGLAKEHSEAFASYSAPFLSFLKIIFAPFNWLFMQWRKLISRIFKTGNKSGLNEDELMTIVEEAEQAKSISVEQSTLIQNAIGFGELEAWDVLTPRVDIKAIELDETKENIEKLFKASGFSRLPVYEDDLDKILGVLKERDFHQCKDKSEFKVEDYIKPVIYVAGSMKAGELLKKLQKNKCRMAIIVDEYGGTAGIVTVEDIVEELVGEIYDEGETVAGRDVTLLQNGSYRVLGSANLEKVLDFFDEDEEINATTVNGWVVLELDRLAKVGDTFDYKIGSRTFVVKVTKADKRKATEINIRVIEDDENELAK